MMRVEEANCSYPATLDEAVALLADKKSRGKLMAGGTDLMAQWESGLVPVPERVISLLAAPELHGIRENETDIIVGACVTHSELQESPLVQQCLPALGFAVAQVGGAQIQARGTVGGNIANASPAGDLAPPLLITDGIVALAGQGGEREVKLTEFFLDYRKIDLHPDELIVRFLLPKKPETGKELFRKLGTRAAQAISKIMGACRVRVENGCIESFAVALGSVAPTVVRLPDLESWIIGKSLDEETIAEAERLASAEVRPIDDIRSTADYRKWVSGRLVRGFLEELKG